MKSKFKKYRPCNGRTVSFSILSFMLFFVTIAGILPNVETKEKNIAFYLILFFFLLHILFVLYSILKLNSPVCIGKDEIFQKQFGKIVSINYDEITNVKLSYSFYVTTSYAIKIYANNKRIMFEITSKVFYELMKCCCNFEVKEKIERKLKEKGIY